MAVTIRKKKLVSLPKLKKKAWKLISVHVRSLGSSEELQQCYTCICWFPWKEMDCGHYIHGKLDFDLRNLKPQCTRCNKWLHGNLGMYGERLLMTHGSEWVSRLRKDAQVKGNYYTRIELNEIILKYG